MLRLAVWRNRCSRARAFGPGLLLVLLAAALFPSLAQAHHSPPVQFQALLAATAPNVNGQIDAGEWTRAATQA